MGMIRVTIIAIGFDEFTIRSADVARIIRCQTVGMLLRYSHLIPLITDQAHQNNWKKTIIEHGKEKTPKKNPY